MPASTPPTRRRPRVGIAVLTVSTLATVLLIGSAGAAFACSCAPPPPPQEALDRADAVFAGEVVHVEGGEGPVGKLTATVEVDQVWKGGVPSRVEVSTASDSATCGYDFRTGEAVLVYAFGDPLDGLSTNLCERTAPLDAADEDLAALGPVDVPVADGPQDPPGDGPLASILEREGALLGALLTAAVAVMIAALLVGRRRRR